MLDRTSSRAAAASFRPTCAYKPTFDVRRVDRGLWTYDLYLLDQGKQEIAVGEHPTRRSAEKAARRALREAVAERLVLEDRDGKTFGGWAFLAAKARIREHLLASMAGEGR